MSTSLIPNGQTSFRMTSKANTINTVIKSTDSDTNPSAPTYSSVTPSLDSVNNKVNVTLASGDIAFVSVTKQNKPYQSTNPKAVSYVEPKVFASNSNSIYKGNLLTMCVTEPAVGNGTNGYESKVLENVLLDTGYDVLVTAGKPFDIINGLKYAFQGFDNENVNRCVSLRVGSTAYGITYSSSAISPLGDASWTKISDNRFVGTTPVHSTIALDNSNSPASKWFEGLCYDDDYVYPFVVIKEMIWDYSADAPGELGTLQAGVAFSFTRGDKVKLTGFNNTTFNNQVFEFTEPQSATYSAVTLDNYYIRPDGSILNHLGNNFTVFKLWDGNGFGDDDKFTQLTNGTLIDLNGNTIVTKFMVGSPIGRRG